MSRKKSVATEIIEIDKLFDAAFTLTDQGSNAVTVMNVARNRLKALRTEAEILLRGDVVPGPKDGVPA